MTMDVAGLWVEGYEEWKEELFVALFVLLENVSHSRHEEWVSQADIFRRGYLLWKNDEQKE